MSKKPEILNITTVAQTRIFHVQQLDLKFPNGATVQYERLLSSKHGAVMIVPMLDANTVLLIREYAAGTNRYELALPKGKIEAEEDILQAANREIQEEIGYAARNLLHIHSMTLAPGYLSHTTHLILATDLYPSRAEGDEPEAIEVIPWQLDDMNLLLQQEEFTEARSIAALYMIRDRLRGS